MIQKIRSKKGQLWIESVLYTLIGLALIGTALAIMTPKITAMKERTIADQTVASLAAFDNKIREVIDKGPGNKREISAFILTRGTFKVDSTNNKLIVTLDTFKKPYSQIGTPIERNGVTILTTERPGGTIVTLTLNYEGVANIRYADSSGNPAEIDKDFSSSNANYKFVIENKGIGPAASDGLIIMIDEIS